MLFWASHPEITFKWNRLFFPFCPFRLSREWKVNRVGIISVSLGITILGIKGDGHCEFCDRFEEEL